jgi:transposase
VYVGIDVAKKSLDIAVVPSGAAWQAATTQEGLAALAAHLVTLQPTLIVLEATGGYEQPLLAALHGAALPVALVNPQQVRAFARAAGRRAKSDRLDARLLASFAQTMHPPLHTAPDPLRAELAELLSRRRELLAMRTAEENRLKMQRSDASYVRRSLEALITHINQQLDEIDQALKELVKRNETLHEQSALLGSVPGVGAVVSMALLALLPELGRLSPRKLAALVGVAPFTQESGQRKGRRSIGGGRAYLRSVLYMAAFAAHTHNPVIRALYLRLRAAGKPFKVAMVACMHKLLTILNAVMRDQRPWLAPAPFVPAPALAP